MFKKPAAMQVVFACLCTAMPCSYKVADQGVESWLDAVDPLQLYIIYSIFQYLSDRSDSQVATL